MFGFFEKKAEKASFPVIRDPLDVIPMKPESVDIKRDSSGLIHLRLNVEVKGFAKKVGHWFGYDYSRKIQLDEHGTLYYSHVDGKTTLKDIVKKMSQKLNRNKEDTTNMVVLFTRTLMTSNFLVLKVPQSAISSK